MKLSTIASLPKVQIITAKLIQATSKVNGHVIIESLMWRQKIKIPIDATPNNIEARESAINWLEARGFPILAYQQTNDIEYVITSDLSPLPRKEF